MWREKEAVIFDLDGTLVDSMWIWRDIDIEFLGSRNLPFSEDIQEKIEGMSFRETAEYFKERFPLTETVEELMDLWNEMAFEKYKNEIPLKPGVVEFLKMLKQNNIKTGIASSNSLVLIETVLKTHGIYEYFDSIHTANEVEKGKPSPDIYLLVAKDLNVEPSNCLIFEDIVMGILAGKNAGMTTCAIEDEYSKENRKEKQETAEYYIQDYFELL